MQQVGQMSGQFGQAGGDGSKDELEEPLEHVEQAAPVEEEKDDEEKPDAAAPGRAGSERAPEQRAGSGESHSPAMPVRPPAPTRPAEAADGINL
jgi:hypothetical protein